MASDVEPMAEGERDTALSNSSDEAESAKPPNTPPNATVPLLSITSSTPISNKISGSHTYASQVKSGVELNVALAKEMQGRFLGALPPQQFLDEHVPLKAGITSQGLRKNQLEGHFDALASTKNELEMYRIFIEALGPFLGDMVFRDSHAHPDVDRDKLAPDIALYHKNDQPSDGPTSFMKMSAFVELKKSETADPFLDPTDPKYKPPDVGFERTEKIPTENRGQIGAYTAAISGTQFRVHVFSVSICGKTARFVRWDRAGAIVSRSFNYVKEPHLLADFFWRYSHLDRRQQGYDPTVSVATKEEVAIMEKASCKDRLKDANKYHREFRKLMVADRDDPKKEKPFLISYPPRYESRSPFSRATRAMLAFDLIAGKIVFLKDYWRADVAGMEKEGAIYTILERKKVKNIAPFGMGNDVRDHKTVTQMSLAALWAVPTKGIICLSHYRMTLDVVGRSLTEFDSSREFISAIADAMEAHDSAYFDAHILHRDISVGNILFTDNKKGMLIDWDLCANLALNNEIARRPSRTGTWQFMSAMLLDDPDRAHQIEDDRESAFHVLLWIALRYSDHTEHPRPHDQLNADLPTSASTSTATNDVVKLLQAFDEEYTDGTGHVRGGNLKENFFTTDILSRLNFDKRPELDALVAELVRFFKVRYETPPEPTDFEALKKTEAMIEKFPYLEDLILVRDTSPAYKYQNRMNQLRAQDWLVNTIRKHLETGNWPNDKAKAQKILPKTGSKRKLKQDQANLDERATKRPSSSSSHN